MTPRTGRAQVYTDSHVDVPITWEESDPKYINNQQEVLPPADALHAILFSVITSKQACSAQHAEVAPQPPNPAAAQAPPATLLCSIITSTPACSSQLSNPHPRFMSTVALHAPAASGSAARQWHREPPG